MVMVNAGETKKQGLIAVLAPYVSRSYDFSPLTK